MIFDGTRHRRSYIFLNIFPWVTTVFFFLSFHLDIFFALNQIEFYSEFYISIILKIVYSFTCASKEEKKNPICTERSQVHYFHKVWYINNLGRQIDA